MKNLVSDDIYKKLKKEEVICMPTDTVWGLLCKASSDKAVQRIYQLKNRNSNKPLALLVSGVEMAKNYINLNKDIKKLLECEQPITVIASLKLPFTLSRYINLKTQNIGLRIPKNPDLTALIERIGEPLVATSANLSGQEFNKEEFFKLYKNKLAIYDFETKTVDASAIIDYSLTPPRIIRATAKQKEFLKEFNVR